MTLAAEEVPRVLGVLVCEVLEVEVEPAAVNAAVVPIGAVVAAVAVAAAIAVAFAAAVAVAAGCITSVDSTHLILL